MSRRDVYDGDAPGCIRGAPYTFPLGECARSGNIEGLLYQLDHGADINDVDYRNETALILAATWDQLKSVELLLERGADVHHVGCLGNALAMLQPGWRPNALDVAQLLLSKGCSPNGKADYCESAVEKWTALARTKLEKKVAPKLLQMLLLILPHSAERAPDVSAAIDTLEKKLGKSAAKDKKAAQSLQQLAQATGKTWPADVRKAAGAIDKNGETIKQIVTTVLSSQASVAHAQWPALVRHMIGMSKSYADATKATYGKALPLSKIESDEGGAMDYFADEHLYTWDWLLTMLGEPAPQTHAAWADLFHELCRAKQKAVGYYSFGDDEVAALLAKPSVKEREDFAQLVAAAKKAFPYASCFGGNGELRDFDVSSATSGPKKSASKKPSARKAPGKKALAKKAPAKKKALAKKARRKT